MKKLVFILILLSSQAFADKNISAYVGDKFEFSYSITFSGLESLSLEIEIDNPSLILPENIIVRNDTIQLIKENKYFYYSDDIKLKKNDSLLFTVTGEILAGNDTVANADVSFIVNDMFEINDNVKFKILNYAPMPYIRFPKVIRLYPNPATEGDILNVIFQLDEDSEVVMSLYSLTGKLLFTKEYGMMRKGEIMLQLSTDTIEDAGLYIILIKTNNLSSQEKLIFIK